MPALPISASSLRPPPASPTRHQTAPGPRQSAIDSAASTADLSCGSGLPRCYRKLGGGLRGLRAHGGPPGGRAAARQDHGGLSAGYVARVMARVMGLPVPLASPSSSADPAVLPHFQPPPPLCPPLALSLARLRAACDRICCAVGLRGCGGGAACRRGWQSWISMQGNCPRHWI